MKKVSYIQWNSLQIKYTDGTFNIDDDGKFTILDEYEFIDYMQQHGENIHDIREMITMLKEESKAANLSKYAGNDYLRFEAGGALRISIDKLDLVILPEIEKLRNSEGAVETKIAKAREIALAAATEKVAELLDIPGVSISFGSLELSDEDMDWDDLLTPEEGE